MARFSEKRGRLKHLLFSKVAILVLAILVALLSMATWDVYQKARETGLKRAQSETKLADLEEREASLEQKLERLDTRRGLEEEIRSKFDVAREGEGVIVVVEPEETGQPASAGRTGSLWERFLNLFRRD